MKKLLVLSYVIIHTKTNLHTSNPIQSWNIIHIMANLSMHQLNEMRILISMIHMIGIDREDKSD